MEKPFPFLPGFLAGLFLLVVSFQKAGARVPPDEEYGRSSLYSLMVSHPQMRYSSQIDYVYLSLPTPDKYENHDLGVKRVEALSSSPARVEEVQRFLEGNQVARRMVAKWFGRDPETGNFNVDLVAERGNYNASVMDVEYARMTQRGLSLLSDAGEALIGKTFVMVSDIVYVDKEQKAKMAGSILNAVAQIALAVAVGSNDKDVESISSAVAGTAFIGSIIADNLAGFTVKVHTHLFRLDWNDSVAAAFYSQYWVDEKTPEPERLKRKRMFETSGLFSLEYVGSYRVKSEKTVMKGVRSNEEVIRKVCARAIDRSIAGLQKKYEVFKVKTPVYGVEEGKVLAKIGMKEGVAPSSRFELLQAVEKGGKTVFRRVGKLKPVKKQIWDNRYMAFEEQARGSELEATLFRVMGGAKAYPGMMLRQLR